MKKTMFAQIRTLLAVVCLGGFLFACSDKPKVEIPADRLEITGVVIPSELEVLRGGEVTIAGRGFAEGDRFKLTSAEHPSESYLVEAHSITDESAGFTLPELLATGTWKIAIVRGERTLTLGTVKLTVNPVVSIPDISGMNIKGAVLCGDRPVAGVVVSDGFAVTRTDGDGVYHLRSDKKSGYVFISLPGGYEVPVVKTVPQFYKRLSQPAAVIEQRDFILTRRPNDRHRMAVFTDTHLAGRNNDRTQFAGGFLAEMNGLVADAKASGTNLYCMALGDLAWDLYWYDKSYNLGNYLDEISSLDCAVFSVPGNHDNDPYETDDWLCEVPFRRIIGPTYYSFNLGRVHYILLDNIVYINTGGSQGTVGSRNYDARIVSDQIAWLKKDLATISDKSTPIVVGMHIQLFGYPSLDASGSQTQVFRLDNAEELTACFSEFTDVSFLTGHTHMNYNVTPRDSSLPNIREHNIAAVCATWWWTGKEGYADNHICVDGSPGGYKLFDIDGTRFGWHYKAIGKDSDYQFRTYDLNESLITVEKYCPETSVPAEAAKNTFGYNLPNKNNEVLINVWDWDSDWTLTVTELPARKNLTVQRVFAYDPLHIISYNMQRYAHRATSLTFPTKRTVHLFKATASSAVSTLEITAVNGQGVSYTQTMTRPKPLAFDMQ